MVDATSRRDPTQVQNLPVDHSQDVFSIPNIITVLRLVLIPFFWWFLVYEAPHSGPNYAAFGLFTVSAGTDWLDGLIARRTGHVTVIGKIIDPLVDRLLIASALLGLLSVGRVSAALVLVLIGRDVYLLYGAWVLERHGRRVPVTMLGKATTAVLLTGFASLIWNFPQVDVPILGTIDLGFVRLSLGGPRALGSYIVYVGVAMSLTAAVQYTFVARRAYREALRDHAVKAAHHD
ncbi:MAG TPA: CDP-alcohol phosphatidyltransferase family protein [Coriobacteriia bacterium]